MVGEKTHRNSVFFSNDIVDTLGTLKTPIKFNDWQIPGAEIPIVADRFKPILGRELFIQLGITIVQKPCPNIDRNSIIHQCAIKKSIAKEFLE